MLVGCSYFLQTLVRDPDHPSGRAAVDFYFIENDGSMFKTTFQYEPYFCISCKVNRRRDSTRIVANTRVYRPERRQLWRSGSTRSMKASYAVS